MALYDLLDFPEPHLHESVPNPNPPQTSTGSTSIIPILISGGASSVGLYAIQLAKLSSLYVIATASERNFDLVRSFGADVVVNYRDPASAAKQIREAASAAGLGPIEHALDCVSTGTSFEIIAAALDGNGAIATLTLGSYPLVEGVKVTSGIIFDYFGKVRFRLPTIHPLARGVTFFLRLNVKRVDTVTVDRATCVQDYDFPRPFTASPEITAKGRRWARLLSELLVKTNIRPNPVLILPRGLAGVAHGFQYMSEGKVRLHTLVP